MWYRRSRPEAEAAHETRLARAPDVETAVQGDQTVLVDLRRGQFYALNEVGGRIWSLVCEGVSFAAIVDRICMEYDVSRERGERDTDMLIRELLSKALIQPKR